MKSRKVSANIFYNILNQVVSLVVPLILSPYVARVLNAELIGDYSYALANSSYFVLIEALGFSLYGMLMVSRNRDNKAYISVLFKEIMIAKLSMMVLCAVIYCIAFVLPSGVNKTLNVIMLFNIIATGIDSTWFLSGMEDFKAITLRNVVVRIANVFLIFFLVKSETDLCLYALIMQLSNMISYLTVFPIVKKYVGPAKVSFKSIFNHTRKSLSYFIPGIINTIFTSADKTVLGAFSSSYEVGVYEQASKITTLCGSVINSVSNVLLPRLTYMHKKGNGTELRNFLFKTLRYGFVISIPVMAGIFCTAEEFVPIFFGVGYEKSIILVQILSLNVLMNVAANYLGQQCLTAMSKQHQYNISITVGAVLNVLLNLLLVNESQSIGVSIASVISSLVVFVISLLFSGETISFKDLFAMSWRSFFSAITMTVFIYNINVDSNSLTLVFKVISGIVIYSFSLLLLKEEVVLDAIRQIKKWRNRK